MKAEKQPVERLLKTARGQLEGILKMVEEDRYCIDISNQLIATSAILKKINLMVLEGHIYSCVKDSLKEESGVTLEEIMTTMKKLSK